LEINNPNSSKNISNPPITNAFNDNKIIGVTSESSLSDKKIMETLFSDQNMFKAENKNERLTNFFGEENLVNDKNSSFQSNNNNNKNNESIRSSAAAVSSSGSSSLISSVNGSSKVNNYFVNSSTQGYSSHNANFKTNFFLDREFISKTFDVIMNYFLELF